jgi:SAM-dependent methyltransferase
MNTLASIAKLKSLGRNAFPNAYSRYIRWQYQRIPLAERIVPILSSAQPPQHYDDMFERLQSSYKQWWGEYGFDGYSTWRRGCERAVSLLEIEELREPGLEVFDAGCGEGMTGLVLASYGHRVTLNDTKDWRDSRAKDLPFVQGNICNSLPLASGSFDLIVSYNTFEHVEDPAAALTELVRLCTKGGFLYLDFSPLYCSPLGLHAFSFLMPYPQFLFSPSFIQAKVEELGANDLGQNLPELQPTNRWRIAEFRRIWALSGCEILSVTEGAENRHLHMVVDFPKAFSGRGLSVEDVTVTAVSVMLRKK